MEKKMKKITKATIKKVARELGFDISVFAVTKCHRSKRYEKRGYCIDVRPPYEAMERGDEAWNREYARVVEIYNATVGNLISAIERELGLNFYEVESVWRGAERAYSWIEYR